jgi:hypothetical protein
MSGQDLIARATIRMDEEEWKDVRKTAARNKMSTSEFVRVASQFYTKYLQQGEEKKP